MSRTLVTLMVVVLVALGAPFTLATGAPPVTRVECDRPRTLKLRRFEDGSAWLECAGRILIRIDVPR
jgi:hypothetical protein